MKDTSNIVKNKFEMNQLIEDKTLFKTQCLINGEWIGSATNESIEIVNPYNGEFLANVPQVSRSQVKEAIDSANIAFKKWKKTSALERSNLLKNWFNLIKENINDLASIMVSEQGKPLKEAKGEVNYAASYVEFFAEEAKRIYGDVIPSPFPNSRVVVLKQPIGVVGIITPWNFPIAMMVRKIAPALACGCTCVIKPDERTPLSAFAILELAIRAGIPKGVINAVTGIPSEIGEEFTSNELVRKISFTGSTRVGKILMSSSAQNVKRVTLELGGNAPFIVFDDADIDAAVEGLIASKFRNSGQTCVCANRIFVHKNVEDEFIRKLKIKVEEFKIGNGLEDNDIGPLINDAALKKVERLINDAISKGGKICHGGNRHKLGGTFFEPTIISNINSSMSIFGEEIFGPVASIVTFKSVDEVIELANNTKYGLASYFYAKDMAKIWRVAEELEYGMVGINRGGISSALIPFGGVKESGMGREGSKYGVDDYLSIKYLCMSD